MKDKREFIEEYKGWPGQAVNFLSSTMKTAQFLF